MRKKRIGLTGGTGFIGQYLIRDFGADYEFVALTSRGDYSDLEPGATYITSSYKKTSFLECFQDCEAVIHLGGKVMHGMDAAPVVRPYVDNLLLAEDLFSVCRELGISNVVNASSVAVYQTIEGRPTREEDPKEPNSVYGVMKVAVESLAEIYNRQYAMKIKSLRYAQGIGYSPTMSPSRFWSVLLNNCAAGIAVPVWGSGQTGRDLIYVRDMAAAAICALEHPEESGPFNIGTGRTSTNLEIAQVYCQVFENPAGITMVPVEKEDACQTCLDGGRAKERLGFVPCYDLPDMVADIKKELERHSRRTEK